MFCHPERSEGSIEMGSEMLRGVYPERREGLSMTGPGLIIKSHHRAPANTPDDLGILIDPPATVGGRRVP